MNYTLNEIVDIVFAYAVEQKRARNTEQGKKNIERWIKAHLQDKQEKDFDYEQKEEWQKLKNYMGRP